MTDDIFDYFGESPRKVEPVESDDFFKDLMPQPAIDEPEERKSPEPEDSATSETEEFDELIVETVESTNRTPEVDKALQKNVGGEDLADDVEEVEDYDQETHWDSLATSLGLEPATNPVDEAPSSEVVEAVLADVSEGDPDHNFEAQTESNATEDSSDLLSEMFVPRSDEEFDSPSVTEAATEIVTEAAELEDDDPFAAFHRASNEEEGVKEDMVTSEADSGEEESHLVVDDDFVEFDVKEFDKTDRKQESRGRRRRQRASNSRNAENERTTRDEGNENEREVVRRKRKRRREPSAEDTESRDSRVREGQSRQRPREAREELDNESRSRKKPKIPTWDEAIGGMIEKNIKRHKSGSGRGGGRKRRH